MHRPRLAKRGAAMLAALLFLVVASGIITLMFTSTLSEIRHSGDDVAIVQALTLARGGVNMGGRLLHDRVRDELQILTLEKASTVERFPFGSSPNIGDPEPTAASVITDLEKVTTPLQEVIDTLLCGDGGTVNLTGAAQEVSVRVYVTKEACGEDLPPEIKLPAVRYVSGQTRTYSVPFILVSEAVVGQGFTRTIASQGEYQFTVGGGKFSQYALFTDQHTVPGGEPVWFTDTENYDGRVHTNTTFSIAYDPWFGEKVTSAGCTGVVLTTDAEGKPTTECSSYNQGATFYSSRNTFRRADEIGDPPVYGADKPQFTEGVDWRADYIALPEDNLELDTKAQLSFSGDFHSLTLYAGDASGAPLSRDGDGWTPASHQYIEACETASTCELYRYGEDEILYKRKPDGTWPTDPEADAEFVIAKEFNGLLYVDGNVERFKGPDRLPPISPETTSPADTPPALASFATMTVVPTGDIRITGDIKYEDPPCSDVLVRDEVSGAITRPNCDNLNTKNVLGVFTPEGDILVGSENNDDPTLNAPDDVEIHGSFMAAKGIFGTENYDEGPLRGTITVLGGIIEKYFGATGTFEGEVSTHGYSISTTFDQRMALGYSPPLFPGIGPSDVQGVFIYSFGQREQVF